MELKDGNARLIELGGGRFSVDVDLGNGWQRLASGKPAGLLRVVSPDNGVRRREVWVSSTRIYDAIRGL